MLPRILAMCLLMVAFAILCPVPAGTQSTTASEQAPEQVPGKAPGKAPEQAPGNEVSEGRLFIVQFSLGPSWIADKPPQDQAHFKDHSANLKRLRDAGRLLLGARYSDKGMIILRAETEESARAEVEVDPSVKSGVFQAEVFKFRPFYDGCVTKPKPAAPAPAGTVAPAVGPAPAWSGAPAASGRS